MSDITIAAKPFFDRLGNLYASWKQDKRTNDGLFGGADSIIVITGKAEQDASIYQKNNALHVSHYECSARSSLSGVFEHSLTDNPTVLASRL